MDDKCLICLINEPKRKALISNKSEQIKTLLERIKGKDIILGDNKESIDELTVENQKINLHLTQSRRNVKIFSIGGIGVGIIATLLLQK
jgi:hypothetical protein